MQNHRPPTAIIGIVVAGLILAAAGLTLNIVRGAAPAGSANAAGGELATANVSGRYSGQVTLKGIASGVYSQTNILVSPVALGNVELGLNLSQSGTGVTGYVVVSDTLVFGQEHTLPGGQASGPYVRGTLTGSTLTLTSERVAVTVAGRPVTRQFQLTTAPIQNSAIITGTYRETLWGYQPQPATVSGDFILAQRAVSSAAPGGTRLFLPLIRR